MTWAIPAGRLAGVTIRVHVLFLLFAIVMILKAAIGAPTGVAVTSADHATVSLLVASLLVIVLAHEFGHCLACRLSGGRADEVLLWPLGGLIDCQPADGWRSHLLTTLGGPAVNLLICLVAGITLGLRTGTWVGVALPDPLSFDAVLMEADLGSGNWDWPLLTLLMINWTSLVVLLLNLVPVLPLDGGRILQAVLWSRLGYTRSLRVTILIGYLGATTLGLVGAVLGNWVLVGVALLGGFIGHRTHRQLEYTEEILEASPESPGHEAVTDQIPVGVTIGRKPAAVTVEDGDERQVDERQVDERQVDERQVDERQVDEILELIASRGMESLTRAQREVLERATARRKAEEDGGGDGDVSPRD